MQAMTSMNDVFMLSINSKLDYETLQEICATGHSGVPVYGEVEVPSSGVIEARNKVGTAIAALPSPDGKEGDDGNQEDHWDISGETGW
jgi:CBS domain containing-hemolysin-like protein